MSRIVIDIETIPSQSPEVYEAILNDCKENFRAPSSLTKAQAAKDLGLTDAKEIKFTSAGEMSERWVNEFKDSKVEEVALEKLHKTSLNGGYGEVISWSILCNGDHDSQIRTLDQSESRLLTDLNQSVCDIMKTAGGDIMQPFFIGHNITFDLKFLYHRSVINGCVPQFNFPHYGRHNSDYFCTMQAWAGFGNRISLDELAKILGIDGKDGFDGSMVWGAIQAGEYLKVLDYNVVDVKLTDKVYRKLTFNDD